MTIAASKTDSLLLLTDPPQESHLAMDRDMKLLADYGSGSQSVVRFYSWKTPTISLGKIQDRSILNGEKAQKEQVEIAVRPTGGRHLYHQNDFCFSIIIPTHSSIAWGNSVSERQKTIGTILNNLIHRFGLPLDARSHGTSPEQLRSMSKSPCFSLAVTNEPTVHSQKIAGVAQLITASGGLIQGSIPITDQYLKIVDYEMIDSLEKDRRKERLKQASCSFQSLFPDKIITFELLESHFRTVLDAFLMNENFLR